MLYLFRDSFLSSGEKESGYFQKTFPNRERKRNVLFTVKRCTKDFSYEAGLLKGKDFFLKQPPPCPQHTKSNFIEQFLGQNRSSWAHLTASGLGKQLTCSWRCPLKNREGLLRQQNNAILCIFSDSSPTVKWVTKHAFLLDVSSDLQVWLGPPFYTSYYIELIL